VLAAGAIRGLIIFPFRQKSLYDIWGADRLRQNFPELAREFPEQNHIGINPDENKKLLYCRYLNPGKQKL
jgi:hypothetical protein